MSYISHTQSLKILNNYNILYCNYMTLNISYYKMIIKIS